MIKKLIILIAFTAISFGQFNRDKTGNYNISELSGDLSYTYPISNNSISGKPYNVSLNYCSNLTYLSLKKYDYESKSFETNVNLASGWLIGINGWAIQSLDHKISAFNTITIDDSLTSSNDTIFRPELLKGIKFTNEAIDGFYQGLTHSQGQRGANIWLLDGYDICNRLSDDIHGNPDEIRLLRSNGSIMTFVNNTINVGDEQSKQDTSNYTGYYYHNSPSSNNYAKVEYDYESIVPNYIKKHFDNGLLKNSKKPRIMKVYLGDGLEYIFKEHIAPYGTRLLSSLYANKDTLIDNYDAILGKIETLPTIFYLQEIKSSTKTLSKFKREYHNFDGIIDVSRGRARLKEFFGHQIKYDFKEITISAYNKSYKLLTDMTSNNSPVSAYNSASEAENTIFGNEYIQNYNHILYNLVNPQLFSDTIIEPIISTSYVNSILGVTPNRLEVNLSDISNHFLQPMLKYVNVPFHPSSNRKRSSKWHEENMYQFFYQKSNLAVYRFQSLLDSHSYTEELDKRFKTLQYKKNVISIIDPENQKVDFDYQNVIKINKIKTGVSSMIPNWIASYQRLKSIETNSTKVDFDYYLDEVPHPYFKGYTVSAAPVSSSIKRLVDEYDAKIIDFYREDLLDSSYNLNKGYSNVIKKYTVFNKQSNQVLDSISEVNYEYSNIGQVQFDPNNQDSTIGGKFRKTKVHTKDFKSVPHQDDYYSESIYQINEIDPPYYFDDNKTPDLRTFNPIITKSYKSETNKIDFDTFVYTKFSKGYNFEGGSGFFELPSYRKSYIYDDDNSTYMLNNYVDFDYEFEKVQNYEPPGYGYHNISDSVAIAITKREIRSYAPDSLAIPRFKSVQKFKNLSYNSQFFPSLIDSTLNFKKTLEENISDWGAGSQFYNEEIIVDSLTNYTNPLPPIHGLIDSAYVLDRNENIVYGKRYTYEENQTGAYPSAKRGDLLEEYLFYDDGNIDQLVKKYTYSAGRYKNILKFIEDDLGNKTELFSDYNSLTSFPTGKRLHNTEDISNKRLHKYQAYYEGFIGSKSKVRRYNSSSSIEEEEFTRFIEKNSHNQITGIVDANDWYTELEFDKNGKLETVWRPLDFPLNSSDVSNSSKCNSLDEIKTSNFDRIDSVFNNGDIHPGYWVLDTTESFKLTASRSTGFNSPTGGAEIVALQHHRKSIANITYKASATDDIHTMSSVDSLSLNIRYTGTDHFDFAAVKVASPQLSLNETFLIGNQSITELEYMSQVTPTQEEGRRALSIDLTNYISDFTNSTPGSEIDFEISIENSDAEIEIETTDGSPCLKVKGSTFNKYKDYTYKFEYDYDEYSTSVLSKVDDNKADYHNFNMGWFKTWSGHDGRYNKAKSFHQVGNQVYKSQAFIGHPDSPDQINESLSTFNGIGMLEESEDPLGNSISITSNPYQDQIIFDENNLKVFQRRHFLMESEISSDIKNDIDFHGFSTVTQNLAESGSNDDLKSANYYDALGRLRVARQYITGDTSKNTYYYYDDLNRISYVVNPAKDTLIYEYDKQGKVKYKYQENIGTTSFKYDKYGNLRFAQSQKQVDDNEVSFFQYDDKGRSTVVGRAKFSPTVATSIGKGESDGASFDNTYRFTDTLDPDVLNYSGFDSDPNSGILTANSTLYKGSTSSNKFYIDTVTCMPANFYFPEDANISGTYMVHDNISYDNHTFDNSTLSNFEDVDVNPGNILVANHYDDDPIQSGKVFGGMPHSDDWHIVSDGGFENLKGRLSTVAYRDDHTQDFNFIRFSYDSRGRIDKLIRFTENIGFDGVFYDYNSANQIIRIQSVDQLRNFATWYSYDNNGRVDSIWSKVDTIGSGFATGINFHDLQAPILIDDRSQAVLAYSYTKRNEVSSVSMLPSDLVAEYNYNDYGWLDSMTVRKQGAIIAHQSLDRENDGRIKSSVERFNSNPATSTRNFNYDKWSQLESTTVGGVSALVKSYDIIGNPLSQTKNGVTNNFIYGSGENSNLLLEFTKSTSSKLYEYDQIGSVTKTLDSNYSTGIVKTLEEFEYNASGRLSKYKKYDVDGEFSSYTCATSTKTSNYWEWRYRYSILGGLESKKLKDSPTGDACDYTHPWQYNLIGLGGQKLAEYHGRQTAKDTCDETGRRVYMYASKYFVPGTDVVINADKSFEYLLKDHLGNVRNIVSTASPTSENTYGVFGDTVSTATGEEPYRSSWGLDAGREMSYIMMGQRLYDPETGRFMAVDPLYEYFASWSPYQFGFNNPISFTDPSGLAPEGEKTYAKKKNKNKLQVLGFSFEPYNKTRNYIHQYTISGGISLNRSPIDPVGKWLSWSKVISLGGYNGGGETDISEPSLDGRIHLPFFEDGWMPQTGSVGGGSGANTGSRKAPSSLNGPASDPTGVHDGNYSPALVELSNREFSIDDAEQALERIFNEYGREIAEQVEKIYRIETAHFTSRQFTGGGSPGMEAHSSNSPWGWNDDFWDANPDLAPLGTNQMFENSGLSSEGGTSQNKSNQKTFIVMPSVYAGMAYLADYITRYDGNFARWYSTDSMHQEIYRQKARHVIPRIVNRIK